MASCGPPPLGRFLGPALLQFAFIRGGSLNVFTPRLKTIFIAPTIEEQWRAPKEQAKERNGRLQIESKPRRKGLNPPSAPMSSSRT